MGIPKLKNRSQKSDGSPKMLEWKLISMPRGIQNLVKHLSRSILHFFAIMKTKRDWFMFYNHYFKKKKKKSFF